jgi:hypothetical protein
MREAEKTRWHSPSPIDHAFRGRMTTLGDHVLDGIRDYFTPSWRDSYELA